MPDQISGLLSPWLRRRRFARARPFVAGTAVRGEGLVLDYGCGVGELAGEVPAELYVGVDRDSESLAAARAAHPGHRFLTPEQLAARPETPEAEVVMALALIEHLADPAGWLGSMSRRLRPGGRIVVSTPEPRLQWAHDLGARLGLFSREGAAEHQSLIGAGEMARLAGGAGLRLAQSRRFLLGANQLFVLEKPVSGPGAEGPAGGEAPAGPMKPRGGTGGALRWLGLLLGLAGAAWVVTRLVRHGGELRGSLAGGAIWAELGLATGAYALLSVLAAGAWWWALGLYGGRPGFSTGWAIWARSQAAKYLPGNVFHYVGRQLLGRRAGLGHVALGAAAVVELLSILAAAALVAAVASGLSSPSDSSLASASVWALAIAAAGLVGVLLADPLARRLPRLAAVTADLPPLTRGRMARVTLPSVIVHAIYLAACSLLVWRLAAAFGEADRGAVGGAVDGWKILAAYPIAWAAGTVTPGAPGGLGVREAALTLQLAPALGEPTAALVALAFRAVTVAGDLLVTGVGWALGRRSGASRSR